MAMLTPEKIKDDFERLLRFRETEIGKAFMAFENAAVIAYRYEIAVAAGGGATSELSAHLAWKKEMETREALLTLLMTAVGIDREAKE